MPLYDYRCEGGHEYELTQGFHAPTEHLCPTCGKQSRRQVSLPAVIFKGSGFYSTDNRKSGSSGRSSPSDTASGNGHSPDGDGHSHEGTPKVEAAAE